MTSVPPTRNSEDTFQSKRCQVVSESVMLSMTKFIPRAS